MKLEDGSCGICVFFFSVGKSSGGSATPTGDLLHLPDLAALKTHRAFHIIMFELMSLMDFLRGIIPKSPFMAVKRWTVER